MRGPKPLEQPVTATWRCSVSITQCGSVGHQRVSRRVRRAAAGYPAGMVDGDVPIRVAATVILVRDGTAGLETLLVRRNAALAFHGGSWVFPGGRMDPVDYPGGEQPEALDHPAHHVAARLAAVREAKEEAGLLVDADALVPFAHWTTPPGRNRRFSTWFFVGPAPAGDVIIDDSEIKDHRWFAPADALASRASGEIELPAPTFVSLLRLSAAKDEAAALFEASRAPYPRYEPDNVAVAGGSISLYEGDVAYRANHLLDAPGPRHRVYMVEPWRYEVQA